MAVPRPSIVEIQGFLQPFPYGREGESSMAARIAKEVDPSTEIKPNQPYGEIWIGSTHANGPATVLSGSQKGTPLKDLLATDPKFYLGEPLLSNATMQRMYKNDLPFLFKILSFDKALPLQAHPDPQLGKQLRQQEAAQKGKNEDFVDDNGKPEISVALSDFTAFVGFRPPSHIAAFMDAVPEFAALFTSAQIDDIKRAASTPDDSVLSKKALRSLFDTIMHMPGAEIQGYVSAIAEKVGLAENKVAAFNKAITEKLESGGPSAAFGNNENASSLARVWKRNAELFGETDVGIIVTTYLMNLLELKPGQGCWILADDIHAYVEGDIIESMANSDSMVAHALGNSSMGGIDTFVDMLSYRHLPAEKLLLEYEDGWSKGRNGNARLYKVPIEEFDIVSVSLSRAANKLQETIVLPGPHTFVVTEGTLRATVDGEGLTLKQGHSAFVRAGAELQLELVDGEKGQLWGSFYQ